MLLTLKMTSNQNISTECEVTLSDQKLINRFARLNAKCEELQIDSNQKKRIKDNIEEAINEILISDLDHIYVQTGEIFANLSTDSANDLCEEKKKQLETNIKLINQELDQMKEEMSRIKVTLYAKFGNNINLEYDEEN